MRKKLFLLLLLINWLPESRASHITGGEMYYTYVGLVSGMHTYQVTLKLYQRCNSGRQFPNPTYVSVFDKSNSVRINDYAVNISSTENLQMTNPDPCITNPPEVCFDVAYYTFQVSVPENMHGYVLSSQVNFRIAGINNLSPGYNNVGAIYTAELPGTGAAADGPHNSSAKFTGSDLVTVCANNEFSYSFAAQDDDGDELRYSFCTAYASTSGAGGNASPTAPPPFPQVPYDYPTYNESEPLGQFVNVDPLTGLITGIAPQEGIYVVTVCVQELRNGNVIATQRKDIQIFIANCTIASASLLPEYYLCKNSQTITISNQSNSPLIVTSDWEFTDNTNSLLYSTTGTTATYTFPTAGIYKVKLVINRNLPCTDSTTALIKVFPGFVTDFNSTGICITHPTTFTDLSHSVYGTVNFWSWDFGESTTGLDASSSQNPVYTYPVTGDKVVMFVSGDTRGCRDTIYKTVSIIDKPPILLAFRDTLICIPDRLQLQASGTGVFSWIPAVNIINAGTGTPTVNPITTTTYYVTLFEQGCVNTDSVKVNVVDHVTLQVMPDTTACRGDTLQLRINSDGLHYSWTPAGNTINPLVKLPFVFTSNPVETFQVHAVIGSCSADKSIRVLTVPYPQVNAGADTTLCYNTSGRLRGQTDGSSWVWSPSLYLSNASLLNPVTSPPRTTDYILTAFDTRGCPKPGRDTVKVFVQPKMIVSAGHDTAVVTGQPLQLLATGGTSYIWSPAFYLSSGVIPNPLALFDEASNGIRYKVRVLNAAGCADSAYVTVKVFGTKPEVFIPTAFTPNNDGLNDFLFPLGAGIRSIEYFNIYNRWGQVVYSGKGNLPGWDGSIQGSRQGTGTFVWEVKATTFTGANYTRKGLVTLIR